MRLGSRLVFGPRQILVLIALLSCVPFLRAETFANPRLIQTGSNPGFLAHGDFNGDGKPDLIYMDGSTIGVLHVLLGNGDGTFQHGQNILLTAGGALLTAVDVNSDGKLDLVIGVSGPQPAVVVMLGNGDGTFQSAITSPLPPASGAYAYLVGCGAADFNGDGATDLIVSDTQNGNLFVLIGNNKGSFGLKSTIQQYTNPTTIFVGDFNGDGHQDFIVFDRGSADATVFLGNGDGSFKTPVRYAGPGQVWSVLLADMDGDGHPDMVVTGPGNVLDMYHGNADGTFATTSSGGSSYIGPILKLLAAGDFNGDGILDIAAVGNNGITILLGKGNLTYTAPASYGAGAATPQAVMADFNQDGHPDFALVAPDGIALLLGNSNGSLQSFSTYDIGAPTTSVAVADFNGDKKPDIAVNIGSLTPEIMLGEGGGNFQYTPGTPPTVANGAVQLLTGDFNGDGKADLLFAAASAYPDTVLYGNGDGTFAPYSISGLTTSSLGVAGVADLTKNGISDIVTTNEILLGQKAVGFTTLTSNAFNVGLAVPAFGDFNKDGKLDMVIGGIITMQILLGNGDGTFQMGRTLQTGIVGYDNLNEPMAMVTGDFDGDGNTGIVALISYPPVIEIWYGNGDGTFADPVILQLSRGYTQMASADVNGDGKPDMVFSDGNVIAIIHNNGKRSFGPEVHYLAGTVGSFVVQDVNGDGSPDIVVANGQYSTSVSVLLNQAGGSSIGGSMTVSPEPSTYGQPYDIQLTVQSLSTSAATPTGAVKFSDNNGVIGTATITNGTASITDTSSPAVGTYTMVAEYSGDATYLPGTFTVQHAVVPVVYSTTTTLTAAPNPVLAGQTVSFSAKVASTGPVAPGRWVAFYEGMTTLGTVWLGTSNTAVFDTALLSSGTHTIIAAYLGDPNSAPSNSAAVNEVVNAYATSTALSALPGTVQTGATVSLTAVVTSASGKPTGSVVFWDGTTAFAAQPLDATGTAVYVAQFAMAGTQSITAVYQQNGSYASSSSSPVNVVVNGSSSANTSTTVLTAGMEAGGTGALTLTAIVTAPSGAPGGEVTFYEGSSQLGEATLGPTGIATFAITAPGSGTHFLTAYYPGNARFGPSIASVLWGDASSKQPDFSLGAAPASRTLVRGQSASVNVAVIPSNGFSGNVALTCTTGSTNLSCRLTPQVVSGGGGVSMLTIAAYSSESTLLPVTVRRTPWLGILWAAIVLGLASLCLPRRFRVRFAFGALSLLLVGTSLGCRPQSTLSLTPPGTYLVTVAASSAGAGAQISHVLLVQVNVTGR